MVHLPRATSYVRYSLYGSHVMVFLHITWGRSQIFYNICVEAMPNNILCDIFVARPPTFACILCRYIGWKNYHKYHMKSWHKDKHESYFEELINSLNLFNLSMFCIKVCNEIQNVFCCDYIFLRKYRNVDALALEQSIWLPQCQSNTFNTLRPRQNGCHFPDIFKCIFLNENV